MSIINEPLFGRLLAVAPFSIKELKTLISTAPNRYKDHFIQKRNGRGKRLISQPTSEIKFLQTALITNELSKLPVHDAAIAYRPKRFIGDHAAPHAAQKYLLKLDFKDFFPSIKDSTLRFCLSRDAYYSDKELWILCQLLCRREPTSGGLQLSIGAPSSPHMSNYVLWEFDSNLSAICKAKNSMYTRYADDLAISTSYPKTLDTIKSDVQRLLSELSYLGISLNETKTVNVSKKNHRTLVGLTLTNDGHVSIGREEKRRLRATMHALMQGKLQAEEVSRFRGKLAFVFSVDPSFVRNLCNKSGFSSVSAVLPP